MKILFLAPQPFFETRGTPINVRLMTTALAELGHDIDLLVYPHGQDIHIPGVNIIRVAKIPGVGKAPIGPSKEKILYDMVMFVKALWLCMHNRYDMIHAVEEAVFIANLLSRMFRAPFVFDMDSHMTDQLRYSKFMKSGVILRLFEKMEISALKNSSAVITVCKHLTDVAARYVDKSRIHQIEDIPLQSPPPPDDASPSNLRAELKIPETAPVALYTGNLEKYQGIDLLMDSIPYVIKDTPETMFVIVGGNEKDIAKYRARAGELGVAGNVVFAGQRPVEWMTVFMSMADILLSPRSEGTNTPLKIYTYLESGKPIVATDMPTHTQVLTHDVAILVKPEKVEYANGILLILKDERMRKTVGDRGKAFVEKNFNYEVFKSKTDAVYRSIK